MNSNSGRVLRSNARRRTPLSNSLRQDHNRSTTELYSPRNAPTSHTTRYDAATSATGAHDALQRAPAATGDAAPNAPASNGLQRPRVRRESPPSIAPTITSTIGSRSLCAHTHLTRPRARTRVHRILARTHAARHARTHSAQPRTMNALGYSNKVIPLVEKLLGLVVPAEVKEAIAVVAPSQWVCTRRSVPRRPSPS